MNINIKKYPYALMAVGFIITPFAVKAQLGFTAACGIVVVGSDVKPFLMRGTNLGNWLIPEGFMFLHKGDTNSIAVEALKYSM